MLAFHWLSERVFNLNLLFRRMINDYHDEDEGYTPLNHLAPRRADYERVFTGVNLKTDIISGTLFNSSGTLFRAPETIKSSGTLFRQFSPIY